MLDRILDTDLVPHSFSWHLAGTQKAGVLSVYVFLESVFIYSSRCYEVPAGNTKPATFVFPVFPPGATPA